MKRTALKRSTTPVRKKRKTPRRGRVIDKARLDWAAGQPCQITGEFPATTHHVRSFGSSRDDTKIVRLAARLHQKAAFGYDPKVPCVEDGKAVFESFHRKKLDVMICELKQAYAEFKGQS